MALHTDFEPILELIRGNTCESIHWGAFAVVDVEGNLLASHGNPQAITYLRSSAKPFQALPLIEMGGQGEYALTEEEIALTCASHSGTDEHVRVVQNIHRKVGLTQDQLLCGSHPPIHKPTRDTLIKHDEDPSPYRHNCSGKHSGMLALTQMLGANSKDYLNPQHPPYRLRLPWHLSLLWRTNLLRFQAFRHLPIHLQLLFLRALFLCYFLLEPSIRL